MEVYPRSLTVKWILFFVLMYLNKQHVADCLKLAYDEILPPADKARDLPPVILLHGVADWRKLWKHVAPEIAKNTGRKVYAPDFRHHGDSPWTGDITWNLLREDIEEFMRDHEIPKAIINGFSLGAKAAMDLALRSPEKVEKLILEDMKAANLTNSEVDLVRLSFVAFQEAVDDVPPGTDEDTARSIILNYLRLFTDAFIDPKNLDLEMIPVQKDGKYYSWKANLKLLEETARSSKVLQHLSGVYNGETLILYATESPFKVYEDKLTEIFFPRAVRVPFQGNFHLLHLENPKKFVQEVSSFINGEKAQ